MTASGTHPDFLLLVEGQMKIGDRDGSGFRDSEELSARDVVRQMGMHAYAGGKRVFVILAMRSSRKQAANALLAFFEDRRRPGVLLLVTTAALGPRAADDSFAVGRS